MFYLVLLGCIWFYLVLPKFKKVFSSVKDKKIGLKASQKEPSGSIFLYFTCFRFLFFLYNNKLKTYKTTNFLL